MKLTKQDLMRLPKERLAEIIMEMQKDPPFLTTGEKDVPIPISYNLPRPLCYEPGGTCINPFHDCINCPRQSTIGISTNTGTSTAKVEG